MYGRVFAMIMAATGMIALSACGSPEPRVEYRYIERTVEVAAAPANAIRVPLRQRGGTPVAMIDICTATKCYDFPFIVDSGASDVAVDAGLFRAMIADGVISRASFIDTVNYRTASGSSVGLRFWMPPMRVGGRVVTGVIGSVSASQPRHVLLLGQSFLRKFRHWSIDNGAGVLVLVP